MKVEIIGEAHISLRAETDEEKIILKRFDKEGVRVGHTGSTLGIVSPALAGLKAIYVNREAQALIALALGRVWGLQADHRNILNQILSIEHQEPYTYT